MADGYQVNPVALRAASTTWDDQSEVLRGAKKRLVDAENAVADLGPRVGPAATAWITTWLDRVESLQQAAERHGDDLAEAGQSYGVQDLEVSASLAQLLPWGQHDGAPTPGYATPPGYPGNVGGPR